jgi:hypothetical protein
MVKKPRTIPAICSRVNAFVEASSDNPMMQIVGGLSGVATKRRHCIASLSAEDCRQGNNEMASFLAWVRAMVSSRSIIPPSGRIHQPWWTTDGRN